MFPEDPVFWHAITEEISHPFQEIESIIPQSGTVQKVKPVSFWSEYAFSSFVDIFINI